MEPNTILIVGAVLLGLPLVLGMVIMVLAALGTRCRKD